MTDYPPPERMPGRAELRPLPADLAALARAGHLHQVEPGVYRRAPRTPPAHPPKGAAMNTSYPHPHNRGVTHDHH